MIQPERIRMLHKGAEPNGRYVLYWMQASQRVHCNHALAYAIQSANERKLPVVVFFGLTWDFPEANRRHYQFMLTGLKEVADQLASEGIAFVLRQVSPDQGAFELSQDAALTVTDCGYLHIQKNWRQHLAGRICCPLIQAETDTVVPVETAYPKEAFSAGILRPKLQAHLDRFLKPVAVTEVAASARDLAFEREDPEHFEILLEKAPIDHTVLPAAAPHGGAAAARKQLADFISNRLPRYDEIRNDPSVDFQSHMSPYLHFGQISPIEIALEVKKADPKAAEPYLEELIVRRELAMNFAHYNTAYDTMKGLPDWAVKTLSEHASDKREYEYERSELEAAQTHDPYWNAAQQELVKTGGMHGYMRMYWGKKILEWTKDPKTAHARALYLNNKYALDGRDPNSFAGISWCFGKHDRAWKERPIFGKVRYMNDNGLKRKFDVDAYVRRVESMPEPGPQRQ